MKLELTHTLTLPTTPLDLAVRPADHRLFAACLDGGLYEVDPASQTPPLRFETSHSSYASGCALLPDGQTLLSAGYDGQLLWHDVRTRTAFRRVQAHDFWSWQLALSPDGRLAASVSGQYLAGGERYEPAPSPQPTVKVFDTATGAVVHALHHPAPVLSPAFRPDGRHLAAANMMGQVAVWDLASGQTTASFTSPDFTSWGLIKSPHFCGGIYGLTFSPDQASLLCCGMGPMADPMAGNGKQTWQQWAVLPPTPTLTTQIRDDDRGTGLMETITHSPDGSTFLMAGRQAQGSWNAALFSASSGHLLASLDTKSRITRARFAPNGSSLFLAATPGQPNREKGVWRPYGHLYLVTLT